jgi:hypothetical protein
MDASKYRAGGWPLGLGVTNPTQPRDRVIRKTDKSDKRVTKDAIKPKNGLRLKTEKLRKTKSKTNRLKLKVKV